MKILYVMVHAVAQAVSHDDLNFPMIGQVCKRVHLPDMLMRVIKIFFGYLFPGILDLCVVLSALHV